MRILYFFILLALSINAYNQVPLFNPVSLSREYKVNDIIQDEYGFLWLATDHGIVFFNGFEEKDMDNEEESCTVLVAKNKILYSGYVNGTLKIYDLETRELTDSIHLKNEHPVSDLIPTGDNLLISTYGEGMFIFDRSDRSVNKVHEDISSLFIYDLELINDDFLAIATDRGINLLELSTGKLEILNDLPDMLITNLLYEGQSKIWASTYNSSVFSVELDNYQVKNYPLLEKQSITDLLMVDSILIASGEKGLMSLNSRGQWNDYFRMDIPDPSFYTLFIDNEYNLWAGCNDRVLWKASLFFKKLDYESGAPIQSLALVDSFLLLGTQEGLIKYNSRNAKTEKLLPYNITSLTYKPPYLIAGTYSSGIFVFNREFDLISGLNETNSEINNSILDVCFYKDELLISGLTGIYAIPINQIENNSAKGRKWPSGLGYSYVMDIFTDNIYIFFGKDKAGLSVYRNGEIFDYKYYGPDSLKLGTVFSINKSKNNSYWLASENAGLLEYRNDSLFQVETVMQHEDPYTGILPIEKGNLLLIRANGVDLFDTKRYHMMHFDKEAQLNAEEAFINNYAHANGESWFIHHNTIYRFDLPDFNLKIHPTTSIDRIEVNLEKVAKGDHVFKQNENNFNFLFTGGWLTDPQKISYQYTMEGYDNDWRITKDRSVSYTHLPPGNYTFHVKSAENEYFSDEPLTSYSFKIRRSFFNSLWFYLLALGLLSALAYWILRRNQLQKELEAQLEQKQIETKLINLKEQLNPHFLFNSFNTLSGLIEENPEKGISYIENITDFYRHVLEIGESKLIPLSQELEMVRNYEGLLKERFGNGFSLHIEASEQDVMIPPMVIQMLVENAIKHNQVSQRNPLEIKIIQMEDAIEVSNNKILKNSRSFSTGLGIKNITDRYRLLNLGEIRIINNRQIFKVILPFKKPENESNNS